jgi:hypothetical protein
VVVVVVCLDYYIEDQLDNDLFLVETPRFPSPKWEGRGPATLCMQKKELVDVGKEGKGALYHQISQSTWREQQVDDPPASIHKLIPGPRRPVSSHK